MDCVSPLVQNKRQREEEHCQWDSQAKKACTGLESCIEVRCDVVMDNSADANHHLASMGFGTAQQPCPRCMAGEPGHINHIMQGY